MNKTPPDQTSAPRLLDRKWIILFCLNWTCPLLIGIFSTLIAPRSWHSRAPITAALAQIASFETALDAFRVDNGYYPPSTNGLQDLVHQPAGATNWRGSLPRQHPQRPLGPSVPLHVPLQAGTRCRIRRHLLGPTGTRRPTRQLVDDQGITGCVLADHPV